MILNKKKMNNQGVAMLMVISTITLLSLLMFSFKFETQINKIKAFNTTGKYQARLNAESGLHLALIQLELYQSILNYLLENPNVKQMAPAELINMVWNQPIPLNLELIEGLGLIEKQAMEEIKENFMMEGKLDTTIQNYGNKINVNSLILSSASQYNELFKSRYRGQTTTTTTNPNGAQQGEEKDKFKELEDRFKELIENAVQGKMDSDEDFRSKYSGLEVDELIANIKYYLLDEGEDIGPLSTQVQSEFEKAGITPKHAPMTSLSELNLLPAWNDELVDLIKGEVTVHGKMVINVNTITPAWIRILAPEIDEVNIEEFLKRRNDPNEELEFQNEEELKRYFVDQDWVAEGDFQDRLTVLNNAGIIFGIESELFKVVTTGEFQNAKYTINAIVSIPRLEKKQKKSGTGPSTTTTTTRGNKPPKPTYEYGRPKVLEIFVN